MREEEAAGWVVVARDFSSSTWWIELHVDYIQWETLTASCVATSDEAGVDAAGAA
jgi:hypothetical protein